MKERIFIAAILLAFVACSGPEPATPPNVVLLVADDMGYADLSSFGSPDIRTPHIDSIGEHGVKLTEHYTNGPSCTPTRTALMTGRYQQRVGGLECAIGVGNVGRYDEAMWLQERGELGLPATEPTLPRLLKEHGYDTACSGKWHLGYMAEHSPNRHGFDEYFGILGGNADYFRHVEAAGEKVLYQNAEPVDRDGYLTELFVDHAVEWLSQRSGNPFFLYVPFNAPHTPVQGPEDRDKEITAENWGQGDRATYVQMVEAMDAGVGRILAQLDKMGVADNTFVIFFSDNGGFRLSDNGPYRDGKGSVYEGGVRSACVMRLPGVLPAGVASSQLAMSMDMLPTILGAVGASAPAERKLDGINLLPVLRGDVQPFERTVFWRYKRAENRRKAVRHGDMKYVWVNGSEEMFNLTDDPGEKNSLLTELPKVADQLRAKLAAWEEEVRAPRLRAFIRR